MDDGFADFLATVLKIEVDKDVMLNQELVFSFFLAGGGGEIFGAMFGGRSECACNG